MANEQTCIACGKIDELRLGVCFDCASAGEERAARRTVLQHLGKMIFNIRRRSPNWRYDLAWAWERLTRTGDYKPGGYFEQEGYDL